MVARPTVMSKRGGVPGSASGHRCGMQFFIVFRSPLQLISIDSSRSVATEDGLYPAAMPLWPVEAFLCKATACNTSFSPAQDPQFAKQPRNV